MVSNERSRYVELLQAIETHLARFGDPRWPMRLREWIDEFDRLPAGTLERTSHYERTRRALAGMGSIADIVIAPETGYRISEDEREIKHANRNLLDLVEQLDREIERLLSSG